MNFGGNFFTPLGKELSVFRNIRCRPSADREGTEAGLTATFIRIICRSENINKLSFVFTVIYDYSFNLVKSGKIDK